MHPANTRRDEHPCLPIHLLARIVLMSSDLVLDPFLGIGMTAIAANCNRGSEALPRRFLGNIHRHRRHPSAALRSARGWRAEAQEVTFTA